MVKFHTLKWYSLSSWVKREKARRAGWDSRRAGWATLTKIAACGQAGSVCAHSQESLQDVLVEQTCLGMVYVLASASQVAEFGRSGKYTCKPRLMKKEGKKGHLRIMIFMYRKTEGCQYQEIGEMRWWDWRWGYEMNGTFEYDFQRKHRLWWKRYSTFGAWRFLAVNLTMQVYNCQHSATLFAHFATCTSLGNVNDVN